MSSPAKFQEKGLYLLIFVMFLLIFVRFINLNKIPIFIDEQAHLRMGEVSLNGFGNLFSSLSYRIFPVVPWILGISQILFGNVVNYLVLGRAIMVIADILSALFVYMIGKEIFDRKYGILAAIVYLSLPLNFFHSRLVLLEPITFMFFIGALYFFIKNRSKNYGKLPLAQSGLIGSFLALSFLSKPTALVLFTAFPIIFINSWVNTKTKSIAQIAKDLLPILLIVCVGLAITIPVTFSVWSKFSDLLVWNNPASILPIFKKNLWLTWWWLKAYVTMPIIALSLLATIFSLLSKMWRISWIYLWFGAIVILNSLLAIFFFPRHLYFLAFPISLLTAYILYELSKRTSQFIWIPFIFFFLVIAWKVDFQIVANPQIAPIALEDKQQFFEDWTSGVGLDGVSSQLQKISRDKKILVFTEADESFGWALTHLYNIGNTTIIESEMLNDRRSMLNLPKKDNIYVVLNREPDPPQGWPLELVGAYPKHTERRYIKIYKYQ